MFRLNGNPQERTFLNQIIQKSGQNLLECLQCGKCTAGCPIASETVPGPRQLIATLLMGMKTAALKNPTWLYCVSCGTCATRCPVEINMYAVATALCETAEKEKISPPVPEIHLFEELFLKSIRKNGRVQELNTVARYNLRTFKPFKDLTQGLTLIRKGAISPSDMLKSPKKSTTLSNLFARVDQAKQKE